MTYIPESDQGASGQGTAFISADVWIPKHLVKSPEAFLRTAQVRGVSGREKQPTEVALVREEKYHFVAPRHLYADWESRLGDSVVRIGPTTGTPPDYVDLMEPRSEAQEAAWGALSAAPNGILNLACGKGKTALALKKLAQMRVPALVVVNSSGLMSQWAESAQQFLGVAEQDIGYVQQQKAQWDRDLVIATIQTLANRMDTLPLDLRRRFGAAIYDEAHHSSAPRFLQTANFCFGYRLGLTATAEREDRLEGVYYAHLGQIFHTDLKGDEEASIFFRKTQVTVLAHEYTDRIGQQSSGLLAIALSNLRGRNRMIIEEAVKAAESGRKVLVLAHAAEHPKKFVALHNELGHGERFPAGLVDQTVKGPLRPETIRSHQITYATVGVAKEGLDAPAVDTILFATPLAAWGMFKQCKGRAERHHPGKQAPVAVIFEDYRIGLCAGLLRKLKGSIKAHGLRFFSG